MYKMLYGIIALFSIVLTSSAADKLVITFDALRVLPVDLQRKLCAVLSDLAVKQYPVTENEEEHLILPTTAAIHPIRLISSREELKSNLSAQEGQAVLPHAQCWVKKQFAGSMYSNYQQSLQVRLDNDEKGTQAVHHITPPYYIIQPKGEDFLFDGVNAHGYGFICVRDTNKEYLCSFLLEKPNAKQSRGQYRWSWQFKWDGFLRSCTLQHDVDRVLLSVDNLVEDKNVKTAHALLIWDKDPLTMKKVTGVGKISCDQAIDKAVCFGNGMYAFITDDNHLQFFNFQTETGVKIFPRSKQAKFKNIAVNPNFTTANGFRYRFAVQSPVGTNNVADIFVCDLSECYKPTLLHACTIEDAHRVKNMYYEGSEIRVVYHEPYDKNVLSHMAVYPDNFSALWLGYMLKYYGQKKS